MLTYSRKEVVLVWSESIPFLGAIRNQYVTVLLTTTHTISLFVSAGLVYKSWLKVLLTGLV